MLVIRDIDNFSSDEYIVASDGSFDGIHLGHRHILENVLSRAQSSHGRSMVVTYFPHPRTVIDSKEPFPILSTVEEKAFLLERMGFDYMAVIPFTMQFASLSADDFLEGYLYGKLSVKELCIGYNHAFGNMRAGHFESTLRHHKLMVRKMEEVRCSSCKVSSTIIRRHLEKGEIEQANALLGHNYLIIGEKAGGNSVRVCPQKLLPPSGEYRAIVNGRTSFVRIDSSEIFLEEDAENNTVIELCSRIA